MAVENPSVNNLAALLLHRLQEDKRPDWFQAGFFLEFPLGGLSPQFTVASILSAGIVG